jgi:hypothetical protein
MMTAHSPLAGILKTATSSTVANMATKPVVLTITLLFLAMAFLIRFFLKSRNLAIYLLHLKGDAQGHRLK